MSSEQPIESTENEERIRRFLAIASHDLQSPPRDIAIYAEILLDDLAGKLDGDQLKSRAWCRPHLSVQDLRRLLEAAAGRPTPGPGFGLTAAREMLRGLDGSIRLHDQAADPSAIPRSVGRTGQFEFAGAWR